MIKDNGFENTSGNGELEEDLLDALHKKGLLSDEETGEEPADDAAQPEEETAPAQEEGETAEETDAEAAEDSLEAYLSEDGEETAETPADGKRKKEKKKKFDSRRFRYGSMATAVTAVVVVAVVVLNVVVGILADRFPINIDLTKNKLFSLSDNSVQIAKSIDKKVEVLVFSEEELFKNPNMGQGGESLEDLLREFYKAMQQYNSLSGGNVTVEYIDLNANPTLKTTYAKYEPQSGNIVFVCGDRFRKITLDDLLDAQQDQYTGSYTYTSKVEVTIASMMKNLTTDKPRVVSVFTGHSELDGAVTVLKELYELNGYEFKEVSLATNAEIDENTVVGLIAAPAKDFTEAEIEKLQKWLNNDGKLGRNLLVFANSAGSCPELYKFLNVEYGIEVTGNIIKETDMNRTVDYTGYTSLADLADTDYTAGFSGEGAVISSSTVQLLTHKDSDTEKSTYNVDIMTFPDTARLVAAADLNSEEKTDPKETKADEYPVVGMAAATNWTYVDNEKVETNVVVSGSIYMISESFVKNANYKNEDVLLGAVNGMVGEAESINVSTKSLDKETIEFSDATVLWLGLGVFTAGVPAVTLIICLIVFLKRRHL